MSPIMTRSISTRMRALGARLAPRLGAVVAIVALVVAMDGRWSTAAADPAPFAVPADATRGPAPPAKKSPRKGLDGKVNLNTATPAQLEMLPGIGPAKAARIVVWRRKNGGFRRVADLRRVRGFGYKTVKRLEPFLAVTGETTLR
jgi:competence protein ComEA